MTKTVGVLALGRTTFDVPYAEARMAEAFAVLERTGHRVVGPRTLLTDAAMAQAAVDALRDDTPDAVVLLQATFTDASMTVAIARAFERPVSLWAFPEPRLGGRLRLNAFCGLNLAAHALGRNGLRHGYLYASPDAPDVLAALHALIDGERVAPPVPARAVSVPSFNNTGRRVADGLKGRTIARLGEPPDGFHTCTYDPDALYALTGVTVTPIPLAQVFDRARQAPAAAVAAARQVAERDLVDLDGVDADQLERSLRLQAALHALHDEGAYSAFAVRCWPETFTAFGGAVCGPVSMMGDRCVPCACEADVYGAASSLILQTLADAPVFMVDLVDLDVADDTGVVWHCGQAPVSMARPGAQPRATVHSNRRMPLLYEFALKPGRVTFARLSQARGAPKLVLFGGEMLDRPMAFTGTSGVVRFDRPAAAMLDGIIGAGLEHHTTLAYGDHRVALREVAGALSLPVLEL